MQDRMPRPDDHHRLILFFVLAATIMTLSYLFITKPNADRMRAAAVAERIMGEKTAGVGVAQDGEKAVKSINDALTQQSRITVDTANLKGSFGTTGLRFDDIELKNYYMTLEKTDLVRMLAPSATKNAQFVEVGLMAGSADMPAPDNSTAWRLVKGDKLTPETPVVLEWDNAAGITFRRTLSIDDMYMLTIDQEIVNNTDKAVTFYPYALVSQTHHIPEKGEVVSFEDRESSVQHIGPIGYLNEELQEENYNNVKDDGEFKFEKVKGWLGITSKYWLVALIPDNAQEFDARFVHQKGAAGQDIYQSDMRETAMVAEAGSTQKNTMRFFIGAKKLSVLNDYEKLHGVQKFDLAVDFGVLYFLTKPLYHLLTFLGNFFHDTSGLTVSFGVALLVLTVILRIVTFPLQNKAYRSMNKMKDLGPKLHALKEKYPDDKAMFQKETMELYRKEKINPASGCLPILLQIPIFFALYKVIYITLDMRHAPFWGWIHDLSAPDPTSVLNAFGLLHFNLPAFLVVGAWPIIYGATMYVQQALNPKPEDPMQQQIFAMLPWIFTFVFAKFPAGLVIYYSWSNLLGIVQQYSLRKLNPAIAQANAKAKPVKAKKK